MQWVSWSVFIFIFLSSILALLWPNICPKMGCPECEKNPHLLNSFDTWHLPLWSLLVAIHFCVPTLNLAFLAAKYLPELKKILASVLPKVFWAPVLRTSGSWDLPVRMEGSLVRNFNNYYILLIHVFDGCSNRFDPCDHFNLVCCCLNHVLISHIYIYIRSCWKISQSLKPIWLDVEMLVSPF